MERKIVTAPSEAWVGGDSFVQVMDVTIGGTKSDMALEVQVINLHTQELVGVEFEAYFYDSANNLLNKEAQTIKGEEITIATGKIGRATRYLMKEFPVARKAQIKLVKGFFADGNVLDLIYERMEKVVFNPLEKQEKELLKKALGEDAYVLAKGENSCWRCVCGFFNGNLSENCSNCGRAKELVLQKYGDFTSILSIMEESTEEKEEEKEEQKTEKEPVAEIPQEKSLKEFLREMKLWIILLLFLSGVLIATSIFIKLTHMK